MIVALLLRIVAIRSSSTVENGTPRLINWPCGSLVMYLMRWLMCAALRCSSNAIWAMVAPLFRMAMIWESSMMVNGLRGGMATFLGVHLRLRGGRVAAAEVRSLNLRVYW